MSTIKKNIFILFLFLFLKTSYGQVPKNIVKNYEVPFSNGVVWSFAQDSLGYLYFGMEGGIAVYDGSEWEFIKMQSETTRSIFVDHENNLWYGAVNDFGRIKKSKAKGIYIESLTGLFSQEIQKFGDIWSIKEVKNNIFFQSRYNIFVYNPIDGLLKKYKVEDSYHRAFTKDTLYIINQQGTGLSVFNGSGFTPLIGGGFFKNNIISGSISVSADTLLIGTRSRGVFKYNLISGVVIPAFKKHKETIDFLVTNKLYGMTLFPGGDIAFATLLNGTIITNHEGNITNYLNNQSGISDNKHYALFLSEDFNLWICHKSGCDVFDINSPISWWDKQAGINGFILDIAKYKNGILAGGSDGLYFLPNPHNENHSIEELIKTEIWDLQKLDEPGKQSNFVIIASSDGLYQMDQGILKHVYPNELILKITPLNSDKNYLLAFTPQSILVFKVFNHNITYEGEISGLFGEFRTVSQTGDEYIWIGTRSNQLIKIKQGEILKWLKDKFTEIQAQIYNVDIMTDVIAYRNQTYFTNDNGVFGYNEKTDTLERTKEFGEDVFQLREPINVLEEDNHGNIWLGDNKILINRQDGSYTLHHLPYENIKNFNIASMFLHTDNDKTWIAGNKGIYLFDRSKISMKQNERTVIINKISVKDSIYYIYENNYSNQTEYLKCGNNISIYFSLPIYGNKSKINFSYFLDGYSSEWSDWSAQQFATFTKLKPGNYTFKVKAKCENIFETTFTSYGIHIEKPWHLTHLAIFGYFILGAIFLYLFIRLYFNLRAKFELKIEKIIQTRLHQKYFLHYYNNSEEDSKEMQGEIKVPLQINDKVLKSNDDKLLNNILNIIEENIEDSSFNVSKLCETMNMSQTMLYRNIKSSTGSSISGFIRKVRLKKAMQFLVDTNLTISEVAYKSGFNDPGYFTKCFIAEFGMSPRSFQRFNS